MARMVRITIPLLALLVVSLAVPAAAALSEAPRLRAAYDQILAADFDKADATLRTGCAPAPREACQVLGVAVTWWRILQDPDNRALDAAFLTQARAAIEAATAWTRREPGRAEAWFYLAGSYAPLVQWRVMRSERLAAALDGKRIKDALERALALDPALSDAHFGIGLYHYYAAVAPAAARMLRFLLLLPGGDRATGLREMIDTRDKGTLLQGEADYQLHWLYLWYENQPKEARRLLEGLAARYPTNPIFMQRQAEVASEYFHDHPTSARIWETLLDAAIGRKVKAAEIAVVRARLGLAVELEQLFETDRAIDHLNAVVAAAPSAPHGALARAHLLLGDAYLRLARTDEARSAYRSALARVPAEATDLRARAQAGLRRSPESSGRAYALSLDGWRAMERGEASRAAALLERAAGLAPADVVIQVRYATAMNATGDHLKARRLLESMIGSRTVMPEMIRATAFAEYASALEQGNERTRAIEYYERALSASGGDPRAYTRARDALARLRA